MLKQTHTHSDRIFHVVFVTHYYVRPKWFMGFISPDQDLSEFRQGHIILHTFYTHTHTSFPPLMLFCPTPLNSKSASNDFWFAFFRRYAFTKQSLVRHLKYPHPRIFYSNCCCNNINEMRQKYAKALASGDVATPLKHPHTESIELGAEMSQFMISAFLNINQCR